MLTDRQKQVLELQSQGLTQHQIAAQMGISDRNVRRLLDRSKKHLDPAIEAGMRAANTDLVPQLQWVKVPATEDAPGYSVMLKPGQPSIEDMAERIKAAFADMPAADPVPVPEQVMDDLCNVFPFYDVHFGMHAWGKETGSEDYDLKLAESDLSQAFERILARTPFGDTAVILLGGDFFHADDNTAQTPASKHNLDVDGRFFKVVETAIGTIGRVIQRAASRHKNVIVRVLPGNHDPHSHLLLTFALFERFRGQGNVTVQKDARDTFMFQWGNAGIFADHGDKLKTQEWVLKLADVCPFWSQTYHRHGYRGHLHRMQSERVGGVLVERLDAFCPPDQYGSRWSSRRMLKVDTFCKFSGRVGQQIDPVGRAIG
jgi:hypothetical protein